MKQFAVLGLGQFGQRVATDLTARGQDVLAIDRDGAVVASLKDKVAHAVCADITDEEAMTEVGLEDVEAAIVAIGEDQLASILATAVLRKIGVTRIIARAVTPTEARILRMIGANEVIFPEDEIGQQLADRLVTPGYFEVLTTGSGRKVVELGVMSEWIGNTLGEIGFRARYAVTVLAIKREKTVITDRGETSTEVATEDMPGADDRLEEGDVLVLFGPEEKIAELRELGG